jgi:hypothetical protein
MHDDVVVSQNTTINGHALLTAPCGFKQQYQLIILYHGFEVENESIRFGYLLSLVSLKKSLELHQDEWSLKLMDLWELPLGVNVTPRLTSEEMETPMVLFAEQQSHDMYHFIHLVPAVYQLQIQYKSFLVEKKIQIPSNDVTLVFPAMFPITFHVLNSRGTDIGDATIQLRRGSKTVDLKSNVSGTLLSVPPGSYVVTVLSQGQIISQRSLKVESERYVDLFTTQEPVFPLLVLVLVGIIVLISLAISIIKKDPFHLLVIFVLGLSVVGIVSPWWVLQGSSSEVQTFSVLYLIPLDLVTTTKTSQFIGGELAFFPNLFVNIMTTLPILTIMGCFLIFLSLVFKRVDKKKLHLFTLVCTFFILICSLVLFSLAMSTFTEVGVGSFFGNGTVDVSEQGQGGVIPVMCQWGPGIGFWLYLASVVVLGCSLVMFGYKIMKEKR